MNGTSFLLLLIFLVAGYVLHPIALPKLQENGYGIIDAHEDMQKEPAAPQNLESRITDEPTDAASNNVENPAENPKTMTGYESKTAAKVETASTASIDEAEVLSGMKKSIKSGEITEFRFDQVKEWKSTGVERVNGESYATGTVSYIANTLFGEQTHEAKALFKGAKLVKWVWAVNNFEMK